MTSREGDKALEVGRDFGPYEILEKVGSGAASIVYRARNRRMDKIVALKILSRRLTSRPKFVDRFIAEARAAGRLSHPNIVRGIDVGEVQGRYFFSMEYVDGPTLDALLTSGPLDEDTALNVALDIARALDHAESNGIIHRDVKPSNIILDGDRALLLDMGLAVRSDAASDEREGAVLGTPDYMSPEQIRGQADVDTRADLYSLGITLYQMLLGLPPFEGRTPREVMELHCTEDLPSLVHQGVTVSQEVVRLLSCLTAKDRSMRPERPADVVSEIESLLKSPRTPALRAPERKGSVRISQRRRRKSTDPLVILAIAAVLFLGVILLLSFTGGDGAQGPEPAPHRSESPAAPRPRDSRLQRDETELREILSRLEEDPSRLPEALEQLKALAGRSTGPFAEKVWTEIRAVRARASLRFKELVDPVQKKIPSLLLNKRFPEARTLLSALEEKTRAQFGSLKAFEAISAMRGQISKKEAAYGAMLCERMEVLILNERLEEADKLLIELEGLSDPATRDRLLKLKGRLRTARRDWEDGRLQREGEALLAEGKRLAVPLLKKWDFIQSLDVLEKRRAAIRHKETWKAVTRHIRDIELLQNFLKALGGKSNQAAGKPFKIGEHEGTIARVERQRVFLKKEKVQLSFKLKELTSAEMDRLVELGLPLSMSKELHRGFLVYHLFLGDRRKARTILKALSLPDVQRRHYEEALSEGR